MIRTILSIAGKPGLYRLVNQGRNMLIVESLSDGKRTPAYARDKVMSLGDIAMYTYGDDIPLADVLELVKAKAEGQPVDVKALKNDADLFNYFGEILTDFDRERVHASDIRKLFQWYNLLLKAGITEYKAPQPEAPAAEGEAEAPEAPAE